MPNLDRRSLLVAAALLSGCPPTTTSTSSDDSRDATTTGDEIEAGRHDRGGRTDLRREGQVIAGDYLFELADEEGAYTRRVASLSRVVGDELEIRDGTASVRLSRHVAWPMMCVTQPTTFTDGGLRVVLERGAAVYVLAADGTGARIATALGVEHSRVLDRSELSLTDCVEEEPASGSRYIAVPAQPGDAPCLFADPDPADESEGLPVPSGAPLETLEDDGEWARVRVARPGAQLEGWLPLSLVAEEASGAPSWAEAGLRAGRCAFPGRRGSEYQTQAWIERSDASMPAFPPEHFEPAMRAGEASVRQCWTEALAAHPDHGPSRIDVRIEVDGDGQVSRADVVASQGTEESLRTCVLARVSRFRFPAPRSGVTLRRRYDFTPDESE